MANDAVEAGYSRLVAESALKFPGGLFATLAAVNFFRIGFQLIVSAWSAVQITGRADSAGKILLISTAINLVCSPLIGAMVDYQAKKKTLLLCGHIGIALAGGIPLLVETTLTGRASFATVAFAVATASVGSLVVSGGMDYFLKTYIPQAERPRQLAALSSTTQIALILGTALGGLSSRPFSLHISFLEPGSLLCEYEAKRDFSRSVRRICSAVFEPTAC
jgi:hypothetical protein